MYFLIIDIYVHVKKYAMLLSIFEDVICQQTNFQDMADLHSYGLHELMEW